MNRPSRLSRLFRSYTALRVWAVVGMLWTALAAAVAVFVASAALWQYLNRVEYVYVPPGRPSFPEASPSLREWVEAAPPPGVDVRQTGSGAGGGGGGSRDVTPPGAWHTVMLQMEENHAHGNFTLRGPADRAALRAYYDGPFRDAVQAALRAWEPNVAVTPLDDPARPDRAALPDDADADVWGAAYAATRAGVVSEGTVVWSLAPSRRTVRPGDPDEQQFDLTVEATEERWADR
ncbi:hypothetical protein [Alienimonas sp. DA493]|uniref:hypothetical protein n=1 Tax=Alienimonas sp. DA493 TaxID=3373605 RepID=UPI003754819F